MNSNYLKIGGVGLALIVFCYGVLGQIIQSAATEAATEQSIKTEARITSSVRMLERNNTKDHDKIESALLRLDSKIDKIIFKLN